jgi:hypothetical protein
VPRVATLTPTEIEDILSHAFGHYAEQEMLRTYHQLLLEAGDAGAQWVAQFIDKPQTVTTSHRRLRQVAEERAPKIRGINKTTQEKLRKSLGLAAKETDEAALKKAARLAVTDVFEDALERRAPEISINETALGWGTGEYEQELEFGIPAHVWQTRETSRCGRATRRWMASASRSTSPSSAATGTSSSTPAIRQLHPPIPTTAGAK